MRKILALALTASLLHSGTNAVAGNKDRSGQAGATELLVNPWAKSTGVFGLDMAHITGVEAMKVNIAGLARGGETEIGASYSQYLSTSGISIVNAGLAQRLGDAGVVGVNFFSMNFGEIPIVTYDDPEGGIGTFRGQIFNVSLGFAKTFSRRIHTGINVTYVSEGVQDSRASGVCFDAGIQYVTGKRDNFHFGITLRNVGTKMSFSGSGYSMQYDASGDYVFQTNRLTPTEKFEMPTCLGIGISYDFYLDERVTADEEKPKHRVTPMAMFTSNSFNNDYLGAGLEYSMKEIFMLRAGYRWEQGIGTENSTTFFTGLSAGATIQANLGKAGHKLAVDYSFRPTQRPNNGVHAIGVRFIRN